MMNDAINKGLQYRFPVEHLFVCAQSAEPYSILLLDPSTGTSRWSLRGAELQGNRIHTAVPFGTNPSHLCVALGDKPIMYAVPLKKGAKGAQLPTIKSLLAQRISHVQAHPTGDFVFVACHNNIYTWEVRTGQLLSLVKEHVREVSSMRVSACGHFLVSGSLDGVLKVFLTATLIAERQQNTVPAPLHTYFAHTLAVTDSFVSRCSQQPRILSTSNDHSAVLYSLSARQILLRITADLPLNACCMDAVETRIFLGANNGAIRTVDICKEFKNKQFITSKSNNRQSGPFEQQHSAAVTALCVNTDGTRLASGDGTGTYCIWDAANGQCLRSGRMNGPISVLSFLLDWPLPQQNEVATNESVEMTPLVASFQRQMPFKRSLKVVKHFADPEEVKDERAMQELFDELLSNVNKGAFDSTAVVAGSSKQSQKPNGVASSMMPSRSLKRPLATEPLDQMPTSSSSSAQQNEETNEEQDALAGLDEVDLRQRVRALERELTRVVQLNKELYTFATNLALEVGHERSSR